MAASLAQPNTSSNVDWTSVKRVLVVKLRSIGDAVLATPSLAALRRHAPQAEIDILLEDWVAPLLDGFDGVNVISVGPSLADRMRIAARLRARSYDVAFNLHGGTTSTFLTRLSGARYRFGNSSYQYSSLHSNLLSSPADFWGRDKMHSAEQQLALIGFSGVPVDDLPKTSLPVNEQAREDVDLLMQVRGVHRSSIALLHPTSAFATKVWPIENYAAVADHLYAAGHDVVAISSPGEREALESLKRASTAPVVTVSDLTLPQVTALASMADIFVGNDSGIAHIAAAVKTPTVVIFGSSNRVHWRPWTDAPNEVVFNPFDCQPCPGYRCDAFGDSRCIHSISAQQVIAAVDRVLSSANS